MRVHLGNKSGSGRFDGNWGTVYTLRITREIERKRSIRHCQDFNKEKVLYVANLYVKAYSPREF